MDAAREKIAEQQENPDSPLNQARDKASNVADKVKGATATIVDRGADLLENLAEKAHGLADRMGEKK